MPTHLRSSRTSRRRSPKKSPSESPLALCFRASHGRYAPVFLDRLARQAILRRITPHLHFAPLRMPARGWLSLHSWRGTSMAFEARHSGMSSRISRDEIVYRCRLGERHYGSFCLLHVSFAFAGPFSRERWRGISAMQKDSAECTAGNPP